jgi:hypothetical protein
VQIDPREVEHGVSGLVVELVALDDSPAPASLPSQPGTTQSLHRIVRHGGAGAGSRCSPPRTPCIRSRGAGAGRGPATSQSPICSSWITRRRLRS